jgi:hypothetical protein
MKLTSVPDVKALRPVDKDDLLAQIAKELIEQREENDRLKKLAEKANVGMTLWKAVTTISTAVVALGVGVLWAGGEWSTWTEIKAVHRNDNARSGAIVYDHLDMDQDTINGLKVQLGSNLDLDSFLTKDNYDASMKEAGFVKFDMPLSIRVVGHEKVAVTWHSGHAISGYPVDNTRASGSIAFTLAREE